MKDLEYKCNETEENKKKVEQVLAKYDYWSKQKQVYSISHNSSECSSSCSGSSCHGDGSCGGDGD